MMTVSNADPQSHLDRHLADGYAEISVEGRSQRIHYAACVIILPQSRKEQAHPMKGHILDFTVQTNSGIISG